MPQQQPQDSSGGCEQQALGQEPSQQSAAARPQRAMNGGFTRPVGSPRGEQRAHVGAGYEQNEPGRRHQGHQCSLYVTYLASLQPLDPSPRLEAGYAPRECGDLDSGMFQ
jgi:hypothetical protein